MEKDGMYSIWCFYDKNIQPIFSFIHKYISCIWIQTGYESGDRDSLLTMAFCVLIGIVGVMASIFICECLKESLFVWLVVMSIMSTFSFMCAGFVAHLIDIIAVSRQEYLNNIKL